MFESLIKGREDEVAGLLNSMGGLSSSGPVRKKSNGSSVRSRNKSQIKKKTKRTMTKKSKRRNRR